MCFIRPKKGDLITRYQSILNGINELTNQEKDIIRFRFFTIIRELEASCNKVHYYFHLFRWLITSGSLIIPALLSIQNIDDGVSLIKNHTLIIYWATWFLSIVVSGCNAYYTLYKIDKQYYLYNSVYEVIRSEGWQYFQLSGKYSGHFLGDNETPTHKNQFSFFCVEIERIKMRLVSEEYIKGRDEESNRRKNDRNSREDSNSVNVDPVPLLNIPKNKQKRRKRELRRRHTKEREKRRSSGKKSKTRDISSIQIGNISRMSTPPNLDLETIQKPHIIRISSPRLSSYNTHGFRNTQGFSNNAGHTVQELDVGSPKDFNSIVIENTGIN
jgi:hypothetical protein